ncbi:MAG: WbqC family protein, partial [Afipia sp.]|nr:WbqC family protein [Afipia sp.]
GSGGMGSWTNRVRLSIQGEARWITCPLQRMALGSPISAARIDDRQPWRSKLIKTLEANYRKATHYSQAMELLAPLILAPHDALAELNIAAIQTIASKLGVTTRFLRQSNLTYTGQSTVLLASLVSAAGGDTYLAGGGAGGYQDDEIFAAHNLKLVYQDFAPRPYGDEARFIAGLSVIDYLMHDGRSLEERTEAA